MERMLAAVSAHRPGATSNGRAAAAAAGSEKNGFISDHLHVRLFNDVAHEPAAVPKLFGLPLSGAVERRGLLIEKCRSQPAPPHPTASGAQEYFPRSGIQFHAACQVAPASVETSTALDAVAAGVKRQPLNLKRLLLGHLFVRFRVAQTKTFRQTHAIDGHRFRREMPGHFSFASGVVGMR